MNDIFKNINRVCKDSNISHSEFRVFMVLVSYNSNRKIYPSLETISKDSKIKSIPDISKKLNKLKERGYIEIHRRKHQSNIYKIVNVKEPVKQSHPEPEQEPAKLKEIEPAEHKPLTKEQKEKSILYSTVTIYAKMLYNRKYESGDFAIIQKLLKLKANDNYCYTVKCLMLLQVIQSIKDKITDNNFKGILFNRFRETTRNELQRIFIKTEQDNFNIPNSNNIPFTKVKIKT